MPLPLTVSCSSKIQTGFTFLVPAHPGSPGQGAVKQVCVCVYSIICVKGEKYFIKIIETYYHLEALAMLFTDLTLNSLNMKR